MPVATAVAEPEPEAAPEPEASPAPAPPQEPPAAEPSAPTKGITILYETGWDHAFLHYNADGKGMSCQVTAPDIIATPTTVFFPAGWTKVPGQKMDHGTGKWDKKMVLQLDANRVEFVTTNGHDWDSPDPYGGNDNYRADVRCMCGCVFCCTRTHHVMHRDMACGCSNAESCARSSKCTHGLLLVTHRKDAAANQLSAL